MSQTKATLGQPRWLIQNVGSEEIPDVIPDEVMLAIQQLKNGRAPEEDGVLPEMIKINGRVVSNVQYYSQNASWKLKYLRHGTTQ